MSLPVTSVIAALLAIIMFPLALQISLRRVAIGKAAGDVSKAVFGDQGNPGLRNAIRAFGNFTEYTPVCLVLLALMELQGASPLLLWWVGGCFVAGRLVHGVAMSLIPNVPAPRALAMLTTYAAMLVPAMWLLASYAG